MATSMTRLSLALLIASPGGCGGGETLADPSPAAGERPAGDPAPTESEVVEPLAPFPYTAEAIRDATTVGRAYVFRTEVDGAPSSYRRMEFVAVDAEGASIQSSSWDEGGEPEVEAVKRSTWLELQAHASYPAARTTVRPAEIEIPAGTFRATLYEVRDEDHLVITRAWFADELPGAPVRMENWHGRDLGFAMTLVEHVRPE